MKSEFLPEAEEEFREAVRYYEKETAEILAGSQQRAKREGNFPD
jgi:hypothetical protein